ncbi:polysaccharide biosynthesis/export family protein [Shewanella surugensis]|uniref:Polysaccharide biosynthesis/export family protein n=1 Tax=Shewanella surugensis TaxID=212020 RepID=A0ABT0LB28_9GAMM|nr:polysaccharide biosynthesis/export family protein [Shewanella surugensis]MCL1124909.1 polysaccharide biosynthesis/export family protein [Shewanella surugensis]
MSVIAVNRKTKTNKITRIRFIVILLFMLTSCVTPLTPEMSEICDPNLQNEDINMFQCHYYADDMLYLRNAHLQSTPNQLTYRHDQQRNLATSHQPPLPQQHILSTGDRLNIRILNGEEFASKVEVDTSGYIFLPYLEPIYAYGKSIKQLKKDIKNILIDEQLIHANNIRISINPLLWAPIEVTVSGAVFEPGQHQINNRSELDVIDDASVHTGDHASRRSIAQALKSSGGISPHADISTVTVTRGLHTYYFDLSGVITGAPVPYFPLIKHDHVHVPERYYFDEDLVRPSQITVPGIRVFISNLTVPATSNSQSALDTQATRFPYGVRLLAAAIAGNCVGGAQSTNASRHVILTTRNPLTQEIDVIERAVDTLITHAWVPGMNPVLLPSDGIACYDSRVTNFREIVRTLTEIIIPATLVEWIGTEAK